KEYFEKLQAPIKGFYTFEQSAHSPMFEEPERFLEIMVNDVSNGKVILSDK
ncbi:MAG: alpha/beta hydrolase, partial [Firmicutes bacterium HGW-Firmicutes-18]